jgi:hypothetical protein
VVVVLFQFVDVTVVTTTTMPRGRNLPFSAIRLDHLLLHSHKSSSLLRPLFFCLADLFDCCFFNFGRFFAVSFPVGANGSLLHFFNNNKIRSTLRQFDLSVSGF